MPDHRDESPETIRKLVDRAIEDGRLTRAEHLEILESVSADGIISPDEQAQLDRLLKLIDNEVVRIVD